MTHALSPRRRLEADLVLTGLAVVAIGASFVLTPGPELVSLFGFELPELCGWKRLTGRPCFGCGLTRSWVYLAHGDLRAAFAMNVGGPLLFAVAVQQVVFRGIRLARWLARRGSRSAEAR